MDKPKLIFLGGGGHALSCWDVAQASQSWEILGYTDEENRQLPMPFLGKDEEIFSFISDPSVHFFLGVGHLGNPSLRLRLADIIHQRQGKWARLISPFAYVSPEAQLGEGTIIHHHAVVNAGARIGRHSILNTGAILEHGARVGDQCHISTRVVVNGDCEIGQASFIGSGTILYHQVKIPDQTILAGGSVVRKSLRQSGTYGGNPLKFMF